jgi:hypothetical protein
MTMTVKDFKIGDEVEIIGDSRYHNGYKYGTLGVIIQLDIEEENIPKCLYVREINQKIGDGWFGYYPESLKLSRESIINRLLEN